MDAMSKEGNLLAVEGFAGNRVGMDFTCTEC